MHITTLILTTSLTLAAAVPQAAAAEAPLRLIPQPREVRSDALAADFKLPQRLRVIVASEDDSDAFAAETLAEDFEELYERELTVDMTSLPQRAPNAVVLMRLDHPDAPAVLDMLGFEAGDALGEEGYLLAVRPEGVLVAANAAPGIFYGVQTLRQLLREDAEGGLYFQGCTIRDWPAMRYRGVQDDVNRGPVPTLEAMKEQVRTIAAYKMNLYAIYVENLFESKKHPVINPPGGTIAPEEVRELVEYAAQYHVEVMPQQQTFGHLHYVLRKERYSAMGEKPYSQVLAPEAEGTYPFLEDILGEIAPLFPSKLFHIGADETFELGKGRSAELVAEQGKPRVYANHLERVHQILQPYEKRPVFWAEIAIHSPEVAEMLPKDMIAMAWDYLPRENYDNMIKPYADAGMDTFVAPSTFYGGNLFPDYDDHLVNVQRFVRDGQRFGSIGMLNTTWDDLGEALFELGWYGVLYSAAAAWQEGESPIAPFHQAYDWAFHRNSDGHVFADVNRQLAALNSAFEKYGRLNTEFFFLDPFSELGGYHLSGIAPEDARHLRLEAEETITRLRQNEAQARLNADVLDYMVFAAHRIDYVGRKVQVARELYAEYQNLMHPPEGYDSTFTVYDMLVPYAGKLPDLRDGVMELRALNEELWMRGRRPYFYAINEAKYDRLLQQYLEQDTRFKLAIQRHARTGEIMPHEDVGLYIEPAEGE